MVSIHTWGYMMTIDEILRSTVDGLLTIARATFLLERLDVHGGWGWDNGRRSYTGYDYATHQWVTA